MENGNEFSVFLRVLNLEGKKKYMIGKEIQTFTKHKKGKSVKQLLEIIAVSAEHSGAFNSCKHMTCTCLFI